MHLYLLKALFSCFSKVMFTMRQIRLESKVTHHGGVTASTDRSSLSTGWEVGRKLTSPAPIYDITIYLIKGSESVLNSCLISERYRKESMRERAREKNKTYPIGKGLGTWKREWVIGRKRHMKELGAERDGWASVILNSPATRIPHWFS